MAETIKKKKKNEPDGFDRFNRVSNTANVLLNVMFLLMALVCIIPVLLVIAISLSAEASITEYGYHLIPKIVSFEGYEYLAKQSTLIIRALGVSLFVTIVGTVLGILLTTLMGYVLSRPGYKLNGFLTMVVFIPMVFNGGLVSTYFITSQFLNLKDSVWALILPLAVSSFNVVICRTFFKTTVPEELIESAKMDGARQFTIFFKIVLPISLPVLATIGLFLCFAAERHHDQCEHAGSECGGHGSEYGGYGSQYAQGGGTYGNSCGNCTPDCLCISFLPEIFYIRTYRWCGERLI